MDNTQQREEGFSKMENLELQARVRELEYDCGELAKSNSELADQASVTEPGAPVIVRFWGGMGAGSSWW